MVITSKNKDLVLFGAEIVQTNADDIPSVISAGLCYYGRGVISKLELYDASDNLLGIFNLPKQICGQFLHGYATNLILTVYKDD